MSNTTGSDYTLEKSVWTDADFERMGWHDVHIHAIAFCPIRFQLLFDIDYIFRWIDPQPDEKHYRFWVSPCTLMFKNLRQMRVSLEPTPDVSILGLSRSEPQEINDILGIDYLYQIECAEGEISFRATGFDQFTRRNPIFVPSQVLSEADRGGFSFACITTDVEIT